MVTRLSGGLTPADGADPRTFPAIWNSTAGTIESQGSAITVAEGDIASQGSAIAVLEGDSLPTNVASPVSGDSLVYDGTDWVNGPRSGNAIINGDFGVWQRGTSFALVNSGYYADRWTAGVAGGVAGATATVSRESFTPADIEATGYGDAEYFFRSTITTVGSINYIDFQQRIEDVRVFAGQPVTLSFWARADSARTLSVPIQQIFGSGGSSAALVTNQSITLSTSWERYSVTATAPSVSGKTIGSGSYLRPGFRQFGEAGYVLDLWGVQLEAGSVATPFRLAGGGSKAAELSLCQRYYQRTISRTITNLHYYVAGQAIGALRFPYMRDTPDISFSGQTNFTVLSSGSSRTSTAMAASFAGPDAMQLGVNTAAATQGDGAWLRTNSSLDYIEMDAEL